MITKTLKNKLRQRCLPKTPKAFERFGDVQHTPHGHLIYQDNGCDTLGVAHLDWVYHEKPIFRDATTITCPQLDDRLGVWVLLDLLPKIGVECDILLTDSEETANSTAQFFTSEKQYNWIFEFDRAGQDVVMYDYFDFEFPGMLNDYGFKLGEGSFTDICYLEQLGAKGFNFGVGYHGQHTLSCFADLEDTLENALRFASFWNDYKDVALPHEVVADVAPACRGESWYSCPYCFDDLIYFRGDRYCVTCDEHSIRDIVLPAISWRTRDLPAYMEYEGMRY